MKEGTMTMSDAYRRGYDRGFQDARDKRPGIGPIGVSLILTAGAMIGVILALAFRLW